MASKKANLMLFYWCSKMKTQFKSFSIHFVKNQPLKIGLEEIEKL